MTILSIVNGRLNDRTGRNAIKLREGTCIERVAAPKT